MSVSSKLIRFCTYSSIKDLIATQAIVETAPYELSIYTVNVINSTPVYSFKRVDDHMDNTPTIRYNDIVHFIEDDALYIRGKIYYLSEKRDLMYHYELKPDVSRITYPYPPLTLFADAPHVIDKFIGIHPIPIFITIKHKKGMHLADFIISIYWNYRNNKIDYATFHNMNYPDNPWDDTVLGSNYIHKQKGGLILAGVAIYESMWTDDYTIYIDSPIPLTPDISEIYTITSTNGAPIKEAFSLSSGILGPIIKN